MLAAFGEATDLVQRAASAHRSASPLSSAPIALGPPGRAPRPGTTLVSERQTAAESPLLDSSNVTVYSERLLALRLAARRYFDLSGQQVKYESSYSDQLGEQWQIGAEIAVSVP